MTEGASGVSFREIAAWTSGLPWAQVGGGVRRDRWVGTDEFDWHLGVGLEGDRPDDLADDRRDRRPVRLGIDDRDAADRDRASRADRVRRDWRQRRTLPEEPDERRAREVGDRGPEGHLL